MPKFHSSIPKLSKNKPSGTNAWITPLTEDIKTKNRLTRKFKRYPTEYNTSVPKTYQNRMRARVRATKKQFILSKLDQGTRSKGLWAIIRSLISPECDRNIKSISLGEGIDTPDPRVMANIFNNCFAFVGLNLAAKIPYTDVPRMNFLCTNSLMLDPLTPEEI